jgi:peptidoglycan biosynthesis protein MviN/MurJ (putative lipid II flippase)
MGHAGISAAVAGSSFVQMALLVLFLRRRLGTLLGLEIFGSAIRVIAASALGALGGFYTAHAVARPFWLPGLLAGVSFASVFLAVCWVLRSPELLDVMRGLRRRLSARSRAG